ncbi:MAG: hypothetical protein K0Q49_2568 [Haloplasmataceae bacterium]|jgi:uncharacterized protein YndB with AHSA1/START domain|nr:hypothetical protein [Haloplasmataceae bacterium]
MLAHIEKIESGCLARFEREYNYSQEQVWSYLTENAKLKEWFPELSIEKLNKGEMIKFDMQDGTHKEMEILEMKTNNILEYTWGNDVVRFELNPKQDGCQLILIEKNRTITDQTPKDLAGWHVCLLMIKTLLEGKPLESRDKEWDKWYDIYKSVLLN